MKKFLGLILLVSALSTQIFAASRVDTLADQFKLNQSSPGAMAEARLGDKLVNETVRTMRAYYSFAVQGGSSAAAITLKDVSTGKAAVLPKGAIVRDCLIDVITQPTSGGSATVSLGTGLSTTDLKNGLAIASMTGLVACVPVGTAATAIKMTSDGTVKATIGTADLTAGKFYVIIHYEMSSTTL